MEKNNKNCGSCVHFDDGHCRKSGEDVGFFDENACFQSRDGETVTTKKCKCCERDLPLENFSKHIRTPDGYQPLCMECMSAKLKRGHSKQVVEKLQKKIQKKAKSDPEVIIIDKDLVKPEEVPEVMRVPARGKSKSYRPDPEVAVAEKPLEIKELFIEEHPLSHFSDEEIYNELQKRGWEGKLQKTVIFTLPRIEE